MNKRWNSVLLVSFMKVPQALDCSLEYCMPVLYLILFSVLHINTGMPIQSGKGFSNPIVSKYGVQ